MKICFSFKFLLLALFMRVGVKYMNVFIYRFLFPFKQSDLNRSNFGSLGLALIPYTNDSHEFGRSPKAIRDNSFISTSYPTDDS